MKPLTIDELYEHRIGQIVKSLAEEHDFDLTTCTADDLADFLWENSDALGQALHQDMFEWMSEQDWLNKAKE